MYNNKVALLPATRCLFEKNKVTVAEIATVWKGCTIQVMDCTGSNGKTNVRFVVGYGAGGYDKSFNAKHDQTWASIGHFEQFGEIHLDKDGNIVYEQVDEGRRMPESAPVLVYK